MLTKLARFDDELARRQGQIATALVGLGQTDYVWTVLEKDFKDSDYPSVRTELIHDLSKFGVEPGKVIVQLEAKLPRVLARRALVLALGDVFRQRSPGRQEGPNLEEAVSVVL